MQRIIPLLIATCWIASDSGPALAQPKLPDCGPADQDLNILRTGSFPDLRGCRVEEAFRRLHQADYNVTFEPDPSVSGIEKGFVTNSKRTAGHAATLYYSTGAGYPPPPPVVHRPNFSISAPGPVHEGGQITVTVREQDSDGQAHHIQLTYDRRELMADPPPEFDLGADEATKTFSVATAQGRPGDGDQPIQIG